VPRPGGVEAPWVITAARLHECGRKEKPAVYSGFFRADGRTRTGDPFITSEVLYQLSYVGGVRSEG
jgi:hypothetical protein